MKSGNNNLKHRLIQALGQFFASCFAITPLLGNIAPDRENWQALKGSNELTPPWSALNKQLTFESHRSPKPGLTKEEQVCARGKNLSPKQQEVLAQIETKVGGEG